MKFPLISCTILCLLLLFGCQKWNLDRKDFPQISLEFPALIGIDSVFLAGTLSGLTSDNAWDYGFFLKETTSDLPIQFGNRIRVGSTLENIQFSSTQDLDPFRQYTFAAFAEDGEETLLLSDTFVITTGGASVTTNSFTYNGGFEIQLEGQLNGTDQGIIAIQHGFCWGYQSDGPPILKDSNFINLGPLNNNQPFTASPTVFKPEDDETPFLFRAFAVYTFNFEQHLVYDENPDDWINFDGDINYWKKVAFLDQNHVRNLACSFSANGKGYLATARAPWLLEFNPNDGPEGSWSIPSYSEEGDPVCDQALKRIQGEEFKIGNTPYVIAGNASGCGSVFLTDCWAFDAQNKVLTQVEHYPGSATILGAGFGIGNKGYHGLGTAGNSFYEFDPNGGDPDNDGLMGTWKEVEEFPGPNTLKPVAFSVQGKGYVALGLDKDVIWEFDPNGGDPDNDGKFGIWREMEEFPGGPRTASGGFAMGDKGYVGMGKFGFTRNDLYEFDPGAGDPDNDGKPGVWRLLAPYPGPALNHPEGFSIDGKLYIGSGSREGGPCNNGGPCDSNEFWVFQL